MKTNLLTKRNFLRIFALVAAVCLTIYEVQSGSFTGIPIAGIGVGYKLADALLTVTHALPDGAAATTSAAGIDLGLRADAQMLADFQINIVAPDLNVTELPNAKTLVYALMGSASSNMGTPTLIADNLIVQTGAGGIGDLGSEIDYKLPDDFAFQYIGLRTTGDAAGDATTADATISLKF